MDNLNFKNFIREKRLIFMGDAPSSLPPKREVVPSGIPQPETQPITDAYVEEKGNADISTAGSDAFSQAALMPEGSNEEDVKDIFRLPNISQEELDKLPEGEKMKLTLVEIFSIKKGKKEKLSDEENRRNGEIETSIRGMNEDRAVAIRKSFLKKNESAQKRLVAALTTNAKFLEGLSEEGFPLALNLLHASSPEERKNVYDSLPDVDKVMIDKQWMGKDGTRNARIEVGKFLVDVDRREEREPKIAKGRHLQNTLTPPF